MFNSIKLILATSLEMPGTLPIEQVDADLFGSQFLIGFALLNIIAIFLNFIFVWNRNTKVKTETEHLRRQTEALAEQLKTTDRAFFDQVNSVRRTEISKQLQEFLAPLKSLRTKSYKLYQIFAIEEKKQCMEERKALKATYERSAKPFDRNALCRDEINQCYFGAVRFFVKGHKFKKTDLQVFDQILEVSKQIAELISSKSYLPRNPALTEVLGEYLAHIEATNMARNGHLEGVYELEKLSMPLELDGAIESEIMRLEKEYQSLLPGLSTNRNVKESSEQTSVAYYEKNADEYHKKTIHIDMTDVYRKFKGLLSADSQSLVLDAGCGSGRDTRYFIKSGLKVKSFDASEQMVNYCNMYPFAFCEQRTFADVDEVEMFHGVWACASLLHLNEKEFSSALTKLVYALKPSGVLYFSIKASPEGESGSEDGRQFYYHEREHVLKILKELGMEDFEVWENAGKKKGKPSLFVNFLCKKRRLVLGSDSRARTT